MQRSRIPLWNALKAAIVGSALPESDSLSTKCRKVPSSSRSESRGSHSMTSAPKQPHHVVIVGAGFGGLETAFGLAGAPVRIRLIDRRNHHLFQPLLYQVATASLATSEIAWPVRYLLRGRH